MAVVWSAVALILVSACSAHEASRVGTCTECLSSGGASAATCAAVSGTEARSLVANGAELVDVRTPEEYRAGHIEGATNVPLNELEARLGELDRKRPLVVYCRSGNRSGQAAQKLCDAGYTVHDLGPQSAWQ